MAQSNALLRRRVAPPATRMSAPVAFWGTVTQVAFGAGGVAPSTLSAGRPKSITRPTRLLPAVIALPAHSAAKVGVARGLRMELSSATAKRQPSTAPSAGMACAAPVGAKAQAPFATWKYPQYR